MKKRDALKEGTKFAHLTVISEHRIGNRSYAVCICDCGKEVQRRVDHLYQSENNSCGCQKKGRVAYYTHNLTGTGSYHAWTSMKYRCTKKYHPGYPIYGGRGIKVCDRWLESFENFYEDMGERPKGKSLDRINTNGNYSKENCRWATTEEQCNNTRVSVRVDYKGEMYTVKNFSKLFNISRYRIIREHKVVYLYP